MNTLIQEDEQFNANWIQVLSCEFKTDANQTVGQDALIALNLS